MDLDEMLTAPQAVVAWQLADAELLRLIPELSLRMRQLEALRVRLMHQVDQRCVAEQVGASSPGNWLAGAATMTPGQANRIVRLGRGLAEHPEVAAAFDAGETDYDQVRVIVELLNKVPEPDAPARSDDNAATDGDGDAENVFDIIGTDATRTQACARYLLYAARTEDSTTLARRAKALALLLCEDDKKKSDSENAELNEFYASPGLGGRVHLKGHLDAASGEALLTALSALSKPRPGADNRDGQTSKDQRTPAQRRADALTHIVRSYLDSGQAPTEGGERPHINVFVDADDLAATTDNHDHHSHHHRGRRRGPAWMPWLGPISLDLAAQISCDADITPIAMDSDGNPIDVGRTTRLIPRRLRRALNARDCGCAFPGCGRPAAWTEGHHIQHWSNGGPTNLSNLVLLCRFHHTTIHRGDWTVTISKTDGHPWFTPPTWIDPRRQPMPAHNRRNQLPFAA
ncbi:DUF222 domain-containing protein [Rhodococcus maanshanensis]|uniref:HNH endonuclease signature motif containing protein n=1 Tax=Rhodococcus maanshanensis TaxID=183556 RepID=UPI0022B493E8|nr:HNH endonuclease signature motif containing protein [Rhodococcus maanshanensis]MCZ4557151.1 DUF222 domain-containing protein [Rhodococcus maanshanensis]